MPHALTFQAASPSRFSWFLLIRLVKRPLVFLALNAGLLLGSLPFLAVPAFASTPGTPTASSLEEGTHVFGESPEAGQIGTTYMVISVQSHQVVGAFYQPSSSFDCFHGQVDGSELALTVVDSYSQTAHPYTLALDSTSQVASPAGAASVSVPTGFYAIESGALDHDILATCQARN
ncbi:MAG: hypothetical protein AAFQ89_23530 [Cyanobacteria bacterium J06626_18]